MTVASLGQLDSFSGYMVPDQLSYSFTQYQIEIAQIKKKKMQNTEFTQRFVTPLSYFMHCD